MSANFHHINLVKIKIYSYRLHYILVHIICAVVNHISGTGRRNSYQCLISLNLIWNFVSFYGSYFNFLTNSLEQLEMLIFIFCKTNCISTYFLMLIASSSLFLTLFKKITCDTSKLNSPEWVYIILSKNYQLTVRLLIPNMQNKIP